jgi:SSS family solute:Na+ symporter
VPNLASADWLILLLYCFFVLSAGFSLKPAITGSREFLQAGRSLPAWLCGLAMVGASLGSQEVLGMGAAGARYGLASAELFALGSIPALIFAGLYLMPVYYGAKSAPGALSGTGDAAAAARSIPEYLGLRFDQKTRALNAFMFAAMALFSAGISLFAMARVFAALHVFDSVSERLNLPPVGILLLSIALPAALVLAFVLLGGLAAAMYNQVLQFCLVVAGLLPVILLRLKEVGGWNGLKAAIPAGFLHGESFAVQARGHQLGIGAIGMFLAVGLVLGGGTWCTDFRFLQMAMAAKDARSAQRAPLIAAAAKMLMPFLLILPGLIAIELPTPHTTIVIHNDNGAIYHDITVVAPAVEAGQGLVPAKADATGKPLMSADGHSSLFYDMATPETLLHYLPTGMLGLGLAALLACLMSGVAASLTAFNTVFACDIYQAFLAKGASDKKILAAGRWAAVGGMLLSVGAACAAMRFDSLLDPIVLVFAIVNAPLFAALLLGALWKRATGHGAFAGVIAGAAAALLYYGLSVPNGEQPGIRGGWIAVLHHPGSEIPFGLETATCGFCISLLATTIVSLCTKARSEAELEGLVHSLVTQKAARKTWWKTPEALAGAILLAAIAVYLILA